MFEKLENWRLSKLTRTSEIRLKRNCASQSQKVSQDATVKKRDNGRDEEEQNVTCIDDVIGKELQWHAMSKAREQELTYPRDFGHSSRHEVG